MITFPLAGFGICGYILWRWGNVFSYAIVILLDAPITLGILLRGWRARKAWYWQSKPLATEDPMRLRVATLAARMGVPAPNLYIADPTLMARRKAFGAVTMGLRKRAIMVSDFFLKTLSPDEQDAILAHELGHSKSQVLHSFIASLSYYLAGWNLFLSAGIPNVQDSSFSEAVAGRIAGGGLILILAGILIVRPYILNSGQLEADEAAVNILGNGDALLSGFKKILECVQAQGDPKMYENARRSLYARMVKTQEISRSLASRKGHKKPGE